MHTSPELAVDNRPLPAGVKSKRLSRKKTRSTVDSPNTPERGLSGVIVRRVLRRPVNTLGVQEAAYARFFATVFFAATFFTTVFFAAALVLATGLPFAAAGAFFLSGGRITDS